MTQKQFDCPKGGTKTSVVEAAGASISTSAVRVMLDDANVKTKDDVLKALEAVRQKIIEHVWPLA
jgi:hypothetical protein